jgi:hypothetical protein
VADGRHDAERGAQERGAEFGDEFLTGVTLGAEAVGEVTRQPLLMAGGVTVMPISA